MKRFKKNFPCLVCGGYDEAKRGQGVRCFGFISDDEEYVYCSREEYAGDAPYKDTARAWVHYMGGPCKCGINHSGRAGPEPRPRAPRAAPQTAPKSTPKSTEKKAKKKSAPEGRAKMVRAYPYFDQDGALIFEVVRFEPKSFSQRRPDGKGDWIWNLTGVKRILYNRQAIHKDRDSWVYLVEGEKDADRLIDEGFLATTAPGGARKWEKTYTQTLKHRIVVIVPDGDEEGQAHAAMVAEALEGKASRIAILNLPGLKDIEGGNDVSDWLDANHTKEELKDAAQVAMTGVSNTAKTETNSSVPASGKEEPVYNNTDLGNARRLVDQYKTIIRYCDAMGGWYIWNKHRWRYDDSSEIFRLAQRTVGSIFEAARKEKGADRGALTKWALKSEGGTRIREMINLAKTQPEVVVGPDQFDKDPWLFNCANGVINLKTGDLLPHDPKYFMTKMSPAAYDLDAKSELWQKFLNRVIPDDALQIFAMQAIGYSMTGLTSEKRLFFIYGDTDTGKTTFINSIFNVMGDYAAAVDFETFLRSRDQGGPRNDIAALKGKRLVVASEVDEGRRLAESTIKSIVGGDPIRARFLHKEFFEFRPIAAVWLVANDRPRVRDDDNAMWRRMLQVPFYHQIPLSEQDDDAKTELEDVKRSGSAILLWMVRGCIWWHEDGLLIPAAVREATADYRREMDPMVEWITDCVEIDEAGVVSTSCIDTWNNYQNWCRQNGIRFSLGRRRFEHRLKQKFEQAHSGRNKFWKGFGLIGLREDVRDQPDWQK